MWRLWQVLPFVVLLLVCAQRAVSQEAAGNAGRNMGWMSRGTGSQGEMNGRASGSAPPAGYAVTQTGIAILSSPVPVASAPGFAFRLGHNVGLRAVPPVALPPGVGNINHPGIQPLPLTLQPLPTGFPAPHPNINFPGGAPAMNHPHADPAWDGRRPGHHQGPFRKPPIGPTVVIYYGVPYAVPYVVYTQTPAPTTAATPAVAQGPYGYASGSVQPASPPAPEAASTPAAAKPLTLLAFKDHTIMLVTDYWLEGDYLYYETGSGLRTSVPLDRLDLPLTQQLNRERNVRFVLESRP